MNGGGEYFGGNWKPYIFFLLLSKLSVLGLPYSPLLHSLLAIFIPRNDLHTSPLDRLCVLRTIILRSFSTHIIYLSLSITLIKTCFGIFYIYKGNWENIKNIIGGTFSTPRR